MDISNEPRWSDTDHMTRVVMTVSLYVSPKDISWSLLRKRSGMSFKDRCRGRVKVVHRSPVVYVDQKVSDRSILRNV